MTLRPAPVLVGVALALLSGCVHTVVVSASLADMDRTRTAPAVIEGSKLAPPLAAHAEEQRKLAEEADAHGDAASADLYAERARVAYERIVLLARLTRATEAGDSAKGNLKIQTDDAQRLVAARIEFEKTADATATELAVARDAKAPARVGPADAVREQVRLLAAISLATEGHLLCGAARLIGHGATPEATARLEAAEKEDAEALTATAHRLPPPAKGFHALEPIDAAARARAACLDALTRTRRASTGGGIGDTDALLAAISARGGLAPSRDERGVVITLRGAFKGTTVLPDADRLLRELGRVASAHPTFPVQIVVHSATAPSSAESAADLERARAAQAVLVAGGAAASATSVEAVGAALPTTDPSDPRTRGRNARLEVVFVSPAD